MPTPSHALLPALPSTSNQRLLGAALAGLLCIAPAACSTKEDGSSGLAAAGAAGTGEPAVAGTSGAMAGQTGAGAGTKDADLGGAAGSPAVAIGGASDSSGAGGSNAAGAGAGGFAAAGSGNLAGAGGAPPEPAHITSSMAAGVLTEEDFKALCDARIGTVELMPHCGGFATAKGFSYDNGTQLLSEHTCAGTNTCGGWNCVIVD